MALFALPNLTKEITVKFPVDKVKASIKEVITTFTEYTLLEEDGITNRFRILVKQTDGVSKLSLDMGEHLDIVFNETNETTTKINLEVSRVIGVIDKQFEATRAINSLNTFLTLFSKSLEGKLKEVVQQRAEAKKKSDKVGKTTNKVLIIIIIGIILFIVYKVIQIRSERG